MRRPGLSHPQPRSSATTDASALLRFSGAVRRDPAIERWLAARPVALRPLTQFWFDRIRRCGTDVLELMHDGCPVACIEDAPFAYVNAFTAHVNVSFYRGATLPDPHGLLEGSGKRMRHVKLAPGRAVSDVALEALVDAAYDDIKRRLATP